MSAEASIADCANLGSACEPGEDHLKRLVNPSAFRFRRYDEGCLLAIPRALGCVLHREDAARIRLDPGRMTTAAGYLELGGLVVFVPGGESESRRVGIDNREILGERVSNLHGSERQRAYRISRQWDGGRARGRGWKLRRCCTVGVCTGVAVGVAVAVGVCTGVPLVAVAVGVALVAVAVEEGVVVGEGIPAAGQKVTR